MKAIQARLLKFIRGAPQFAIPIYQRTYSWKESECRQLWDDILRVGRNEASSVHFIGSIVYIEEDLNQVSSQSPLLVIDGQQRLTTVMLVLEALARYLGDKEHEPVDGFSANKLRGRYLLNRDEKDKRLFKLLPTQTDEPSFLHLMQGDSLPPIRNSTRIIKNFEFFSNAIDRLGDDLVGLCNGLEKLMIVDIALSRDQDNPQLIFESMNSTGLELSQADLIRNFILMGLNPDDQERLYNHYWRPMEVAFGQEAYGKHFDGFMRHYLTLKSKTGDIPKQKDVYEAFKAHAQDPQVHADGIDALVADLYTFAKYYCAMALGREHDRRLASAFQDLRELKVDVAYPFLLKLYHDYSSGILSARELGQAIRLVESYVFRRAVCTIPTNSLNKTFAAFSRALNEKRYLESIQAHFLLMPSYRRFPSDEEFRRDIKVRNLYKFRSSSYWLRRFENHDRKEPVPVEDYTIEHILPQNPHLSREWRGALGNEWKRVQDDWLHTLGNLTLTGYNAEYGDHSFAKKRDMMGGFGESPLRINKGLKELETWNEAAIKHRADRLAWEAIAVWPAPNLADEVLDGYRPKMEDRPGMYTVEDYPQLADGTPVRTLFDVFRQQVLDLDPCVSEEFRKIYIAYKAETNFVDVVPQANRLLLTLNLEFHELYDPQELARDMTNLGQWGTGDVQVALSNEAKLPYVLSLVRQAFEKQMGNDLDSE